LLANYQRESTYAKIIETPERRGMMFPGVAAQSGIEEFIPFWKILFRKEID
jgi:hypothetical protein